MHCEGGSPSHAAHGGPRARPWTVAYSAGIARGPVHGCAVSAAKGAGHRQNDSVVGNRNLRVAGPPPRPGKGQHRLCKELLPPRHAHKRAIFVTVFSMLHDESLESNESFSADRCKSAARGTSVGWNCLVRLYSVLGARAPRIIVRFLARQFE